ncbi:MAG TPA: VOC family protein [Actinomycetota bacterium]|nr:VOC family protein [Actinomycetota bacterium]
MSLKIGSLTIDCHDPRAVANFWLAALPGEVTYEDDEAGEIVVDFEATSGSMRVLFYKVADDKQVKNRLHLDLIPEDQDAEVKRLMKLGAKKIDIGQRDVSWVVMADVEGNEFCVLVPDEDDDEEEEDDE